MDKMLKLEQWKAKYEKAKGEWAKTREELEQYKIQSEELGVSKILKELN